MVDRITLKFKDNDVIVSGKIRYFFEDAIKITKIPYFLLNHCIENKEEAYKQLIIANIYLILDTTKKYNLDINILDEVNNLSKKFTN